MAPPPQTKVNISPKSKMSLVFPILSNECMWQIPYTLLIKKITSFIMNSTVACSWQIICKICCFYIKECRRQTLCARKHFGLKWFEVLCNWSYILMCRQQLITCVNPKPTLCTTGIHLKTSNVWPWWVESVLSLVSGLGVPTLQYREILNQPRPRILVEHLTLK